MNSTVRALLLTLFCGIIWGNCAMSESSTFGSFAPVRMTSDWLYVAALGCSIALGLFISDARTIFYSVVGASVITALVFTGGLLASAMAMGTSTLDLLLLFAFQQSAPRVMMTSVLGLVAAFVAAVVRINFNLFPDME
ncbi:MAG: hypothetical protein GX605_07960 [Chloroflexi bacterium]|nr:hypothetical protein [Chloroflexota bacterium]